MCIRDSIIGEFKDWKYNFETVSEKFHLIEENTRIVFIPIEQEAKDLLFEIKNLDLSSFLSVHFGRTIKSFGMIIPPV